MSNTTIENNILGAIDIIVNRALQTAEFDKTIQAVVRECVDQTLGKYRVEYQNSNFYAFTPPGTSAKYPKGSLVYVSIPKGDFSAQKHIIGVAKKDGTNFISTPEGDEPYTYTGQNRISITEGNPEISTSSLYGRKKHIIDIYDADSNDVNPYGIVISDQLKKDLQQSDHIIFGSKIRTKIPINNQINGNYGIIAYLQFYKKNTTGTDAERPTVIRSCYLDTLNMTGDPYNYSVPIRQCKAFKVDGPNFKRIKKIRIFTENFPESDTNAKNKADIIFTNLEFYGANSLSPQQLSTSVITIEPGRAEFQNRNPLILKATVKIKGKPASPSQQKIDFYWFKENTQIVNGSPLFCEYGGNGWECLNEKNVVKEGKTEWVPASNQLEIKYNDILTKETNFLCVAINGETVLKQQKTVIKPNGEEIVIRSDSGTNFYYDIGQPTLTCKIIKNKKQQDIPDEDDDRQYFYYWSVEKQDGTFLDFTELLNSEQYAKKALADTEESYAKLTKDLQREQQKLKNNTALKTSTETIIADLKDELEKLQQEIKNLSAIHQPEMPCFIIKNILKVPINAIVDFAIFKCTVFYHDKADTEEKDNKILLGTASIKLTNTFQEHEGFNLIINNGTQNFKYNEFGIAPTSSALNNPLTIPDLSFTLFDPDNKELIDSKKITKLDNIDYYWEIPTTNTLIDSTKITGTAAESIEGDILKSTANILSYAIKDHYDIACKRNNIKLKLFYQDMAFVAETNLSFIKQGQMGTNGTDYVSKIQPVATDGNIPYYPTIYLNIENGVSYVGTNWKSLALKAVLYHNNQKIFDSKTKNLDGVKVTWSLVANKYYGSITDNSYIKEIDSNGNIILKSSDELKKVYDSSHAPACIVKVQIKYNDLYQYAYLPIVFSLNNIGYQTDLEPYTGFNYAIYEPDGTRPIYDTTAPHTLKVTQLINDINQDITTNVDSKYKLQYNWSVIGTTYQYVKDQNERYHDNVALLEYKASTNNTCSIKPIDNYDSKCLTSSAMCVIKQKNVIVSIIIMPVHLMLNQYGNAKLNGWDGNSIDLGTKDANGNDTNGNIILAPQVGAGIKQQDNSFTGVLIGKAHLIEPDTDGVATEKPYVGLLGFSKGRRSIFLDAYKGEAHFGIAGQGQIHLRPDSTSTIANWNINNTFLSAGNKKAIGDKMKGAYLGSDGTFEFSSGYATEDEKNNSGATTYNYIRYSSKDGDQGRDLQIVGGTIQGGSIEISNTGNRNNTIFKANPQEIQFGNWHMNKTSENAGDSTNRDVFYYGNWRNSTVGFSGNPEVSKGLYFWAGWKNNEGIIQVNSGGVTIGHGSTFAIGNPYAGSDSQWDSNNTFQVYGNQIMVYGQTLESYIQSLMPEGEEGDEEGEDEG